LNPSVLFVTNESVASGLIESQILEYLLEISKTIPDLTLLTIEPCSGKRKAWSKWEKALQKKRIRWNPVYLPSKTGLIRKYLLFASHVYWAQKKEFHTIITARSFMPALASKIVLFILWRKNTKLIFDTRGFWCQERFENEKKPLSRLFYQILKPLESWLYHACDHTIFLTRKAKHEVIKRQNVPSKSISVVPTLVNCQRFHPRRYLGRRKIKNICFSGNILGWYETKKIFHLCCEGISQNRPFRYFFFAKDKIQQKIILQKTKHLPARVVKVCRLPFHRVAKKLAEMDLGVVLIRPSFGKIASFPTKAGEFLASGIPILASRGVGDLDRMVIKNHCGIVFDNQEIGSRKNFDSIENLLARKGVRECCRKTALKNLNLSVGIQKILSIYKKT